VQLASLSEVTGQATLLVTRVTVVSAERKRAVQIRPGAVTARRLAFGTAAGSVALVIASLVLAYLDRHLLPASLTGWDFSDIFTDVVGLGVVVVGLVLAYKRPANRIGWLFLAASVPAALWNFSASYAHHALAAAPGSWPAGRAFAWLSNWIEVVPLAVLAFVLLLFPDGRLGSRRWRAAAWFVGIAFALAAADLVVNAARFWSDPFSPAQGGSLLDAVTAMLAIAGLVVSATAVAVRYVRSAGDERLQLKWFAAAAMLVASTFVVSFFVSSPIVGVLQNLAFLCLWAAIGVAVLKYRLYEIDIVISKAVLYGCLVVFITAVYAGVVAGVGTLVGDRRSPVLAALAAAVVAVAFAPVRQRAGRLANRVVYGRRATPYQVLSDFARRIGGAFASQDVLPQMARTVAAGTGAAQVVVWLRIGGELRAEASSDGGRCLDSVPVDGNQLPQLHGAGLFVPVLHRGVLLGAISLAMPKDEPLRPAGEQLVADVASQAGLVLANAGLFEDLRASRQRLVSAQDEARRRLERNLHDGAQQDLVALAIKLRLADGAFDDDPAQARQLLGELKADTAGALENLRDLARGIYPPLLADLGLAAALNAQAGKSAVPVSVAAAGIGRFAQDIEAAVYFCCLEALQNAAKYARATQARICLHLQNGTLSFTVSDDGAGYDARQTAMGAGQRNMADRLAALGGHLDIESAPARGTTITGYLPVGAAF